MRYLLLMFATTLAAFAASAAMMMFGNPEISFWNKVTAQRDQELAQVRPADSDQNLIIFAGGSSCAFSIDPTIITRETGRPSINRGLIISAGMPYIVAHAFEDARAGDTVVIGLERSFLVDPGEAPSRNLGIALAWLKGSIKQGEGWPITKDVPWKISSALKVRLGARFVGSMAGKWLLGRKLYRYEEDNYRQGGRLESGYDDPFRSPTGLLTQFQVTSEAEAFLREVRQYAEENSIDVVYALPWFWTNEEAAAQNRDLNENLLNELGETIEILHTPSLGVQTEGNFFSDTAYHLTPEGSQLRSEEVGKALARRFAGR